MDLLEDLFKKSGLKGRILGHRSFVNPASIQFPCSRSIGFHVVTHGTAYIHLEGAQSKVSPISLKKGDIALMARGQDHVVSTELKLAGAKGNLTPLSEFDHSRAPESNQPPRMTLVSGAYQLWNDPVHPFFDEIPNWYVLKSDEIESFDSLNLLIGLLAKEVAKPELGSERAVQGILDVLFPLILRRISMKTGLKSKSWSHATQDPEIRVAIELMHSDVSKSWTVDLLAKKSGLSRAGFALKFKRTTGDTPLRYLTTLRIQKAMVLLSDTEDNLETVASHVGYQDAFGFSKAFKKLTGLSPRDFRTRDLTERKSAWRF